MKRLWWLVFVLATSCGDSCDPAYEDKLKACGEACGGRMRSFTTGNDHGSEGGCVCTPPALPADAGSR